MTLAARPPSLEALQDWVVAHATATDAGPELLEGVCGALRDAGLPLWRVSVSTPALDPMFRGMSLNWWRDRPVELIAVAHGARSDDVFAKSPIFALLQEERAAGRWRVGLGEGCDTFPLLADLRDGGATDYVLRLVKFAEGSGLRGVGFSATTDHRGGFTEAQIALIDAVVPILGIAVFRLGVSRTLQETLGTYLGRRSGQRVLAGHIQRGLGETLRAAILLADLRDFTALVDRDDAAHVVGWLNDYLEAMGEPVSDHDGEVLKFMGDGLLAVFPVEEGEAGPTSACARAYAAAEAGLARTSALNAARRTRGEPTLELDVALHFGEVVYGNVGTRRRLDFTVIGRAINEVSRIELLCKEVGHPLLCSDAFAALCDRPLSRVGTFAMRGVGEPQPVWCAGAATPREPVGGFPDGA